MKILISLLLFLVATTGFTQSGYGPEHNGYRLSKSEKQEYYVVNATNTIAIRDLNMNMPVMLEAIKNSTISDKQLILRVISMHADDASKLKEMLALSTTNDEMALIVLHEAETAIKNRKK